MPFGLSENDFQFLKKNLIDPIKATSAEVFIFGSRASGTFKEFSDVDICYIEKSDAPVPQSLIRDITVFFEDSNFPYKVDIVNYKSIAASYLMGVDAVKIKL